MLYTGDWGATPENDQDRVALDYLDFLKCGDGYSAPIDACILMAFEQGVGYQPPAPARATETASANEFMAMPGDIRACLWEIGYWYQSGRNDGGDKRKGRGDFAALYAELMVATDGECPGANMVQLYEAWREDRVLAYIESGDPGKPIQAALAAYRRVMGE